MKTTGVEATSGTTNDRASSAGNASPVSETVRGIEEVRVGGVGVGVWEVGEGGGGADNGDADF